MGFSDVSVDEYENYRVIIAVEDEGEKEEEGRLRQEGSVPRNQCVLILARLFS